MHKRFCFFLKRFWNHSAFLCEEAAYHWCFRGLVRVEMLFVENCQRNAVAECKVVCPTSMSELYFCAKGFQQSKRFFLLRFSMFGIFSWEKLKSGIHTLLRWSCPNVVSSVCLQESPCGGERVCCGAGQFGCLPGVPPAAPGLLQGHLGLPVLPGYRELPVLITEGAFKVCRPQIDDCNLLTAVFRDFFLPTLFFIDFNNCYFIFGKHMYNIRGCLLIFMCSLVSPSQTLLSSVNPLCNGLFFCFCLFSCLMSAFLVSECTTRCSLSHACEYWFLSVNLL